MIAGADPSDEELSLSDALSALGAPEAEAELRAIVDQYRRDADLARTAPSAAVLAANLAKLDAHLSAAFDAVRRMGPFELHVIGRDWAAFQAMGDGYHQAVRTAGRRVAAARRSAGRRGPLRADAVLAGGRRPRSIMVERAAELWRRHTGMTPTAGGRFLSFVTSLAAAASCPEAGIEDLIARIAHRAAGGYAGEVRPAGEMIDAA